MRHSSRPRRSARALAKLPLRGESDLTAFLTSSIGRRGSRRGLRCRTFSSNLMTAIHPMCGYSMSAHCGASRLCAKHGRRSPKPSLPVASHFPFRHRHRTRETNALKISYGQSRHSWSVIPKRPFSRHAWPAQGMSDSSSARVFHFTERCHVRYRRDHAYQKCPTGPASKSRRQAEPLPVDAAATGLASGTVSSLKIGDRIAHHMFGEGIIEAVRDNKLHIKFDTAGSKEILSSFITPPH
jgi:hypothetical protein